MQYARTFCSTFCDCLFNFVTAVFMRDFPKVFFPQRVFFCRSRMHVHCFADFCSVMCRHCVVSVSECLALKWVFGTLRFLRYATISIINQSIYRRLSSNSNSKYLLLFCRAYYLRYTQSPALYRNASMLSLSFM